MDRNDLEGLISENLASVRSYVASLGVYPDLVDDVAQDVFVEAVRNISHYDDTRPFKSWLFGIARNLVLQEFRRARVRSRVRQGLVSRLLAEASDEKESGYFHGHPLEDVLDALKDCITRLSDRVRRILELRHTEGMRTKEVARALSMKGPAVRQALTRSYAVLRECVTGTLSEGGS